MKFEILVSDGASTAINLKTYEILRYEMEIVPKENNYYAKSSMRTDIRITGRIIGLELDNDYEIEDFLGDVKLEGLEEMVDSIGEVGSILDGGNRNQKNLEELRNWSYDEENPYRTVVIYRVGNSLLPEVLKIDNMYVAGYNEECDIYTGNGRFELYLRERTQYNNSQYQDEEVNYDE